MRQLTKPRIDVGRDGDEVVITAIGVFGDEVSLSASPEQAKAVARLLMLVAESAAAGGEST